MPTKKRFDQPQTVPCKWHIHVLPTMRLEQSRQLVSDLLLCFPVSHKRVQCHSMASCHSNLQFHLLTGTLQAEAVQMLVLFVVGVAAAALVQYFRCTLVAHYRSDRHAL